MMSQKSSDTQGGGDMKSLSHAISIKDLSQHQRKLLFKTYSMEQQKVSRTLKPVPEKVFFMSTTHPIRKFCISLVRSSGFDSFFIFVILLNAFFAAFYDPFDHDNETARNKLIIISDPVFSSLYTLEAVIKIFAQGVRSPLGYFSDRWNLLDFFVVVVGWLTFIPSFSQVKAIRSVRLIRLFRSLASIPGMRVILSSIGSALPGLGNVSVLVLILTAAFGLIAVQLWRGLLMGQCAWEDPLGPDPYRFSDSFFNGPMFCALDCDSFVDTECIPAYGGGCPAALVPIITEYGNESLVLTNMTCVRGRNPDDGQTNFDNFPYALLNTFVMITTEGWTGVLFMVWHTWGLKLLVSIMFTFLVFIGAFFMLELALVVLWDQYSISVNNEEKRLEALLESIAPFGSTEDTTSPDLSKDGPSDSTDKTNSVSPVTSDRTLSKFGSNQTTSVSNPAGTGSNDIMSKAMADTLRKTLLSINEKTTTTRKHKSPHAEDYRQNRRSFHTAGNASTPRSVASLKSVDNNSVSSIGTARRSSLVGGDDLTFIGGSQGSTFSPGVHSGDYRTMSNEGSSLFNGKLTASQNTSAPHIGPTNVNKDSLSSVDAFSQTMLATQVESERRRRESLNAVSPLTATFHSGDVTSPTGTVPSQSVQAALTGGGELKITTIPSDIDSDVVEVEDDPELFLDSLKETWPEYQIFGKFFRFPETLAQLFSYYLQWLDIQYSYIPPLPEWLSNPFFALATHPVFEWSLMTLVIVNVLLLGVEHQGMDQRLADNLVIANYAFVSVFVLELCIKMLGFGLRYFAADPFNVFDFLIILMSVVDMFSSMGADSTQGGGGIAVFRSLRVFRVFKLIKSWTSLRKLISDLVNAIPAATNVFILLAVTIFIFSLLGLQMFGGRYDDAIARGLIEEVPPLNFNTLGWSAVTIFDVMDNENWDAVLKSHMAAFGTGYAVFFVLVILIGNYIFLNLFVTILMSVMESESEVNSDDSEQGEDEREGSEEKKSEPKIFAQLRNFANRVKMKQTVTAHARHCLVCSAHRSESVFGYVEAHRNQLFLGHHAHMVGGKYVSPDLPPPPLPVPTSEEVGLSNLNPMNNGATIEQFTDLRRDSVTSTQSYGAESDMTTPLAESNSIQLTPYPITMSTPVDFSRNISLGLALPQSMTPTNAPPVDLTLSSVQDTDILSNNLVSTRVKPSDPTFSSAVLADDITGVRSRGSSLAESLRPAPITLKSVNGIAESGSEFGSGSQFGSGHDLGSGSGSDSRSGSKNVSRSGSVAGSNASTAPNGTRRTSSVVAEKKQAEIAFHTRGDGVADRVDILLAGGAGAHGTNSGGIRLVVNKHGGYNVSVGGADAEAEEARRMVRRRYRLRSQYAASKLLLFDKIAPAEQQRLIRRKEVLGRLGWQDRMWFRLGYSQYYLVKAAKEDMEVQLTRRQLLEQQQQQQRLQHQQMEEEVRRMRPTRQLSLGAALFNKLRGATQSKVYPDFSPTSASDASSTPLAAADAPRSGLPPLHSRSNKSIPKVGSGVESASGTPTATDGLTPSHNKLDRTLSVSRKLLSHTTLLGNLPSPLTPSAASSTSPNTTNAKGLALAGAASSMSSGSLDAPSRMKNRQFSVIQEPPLPLEDRPLLAPFTSLSVMEKAEALPLPFWTSFPIEFLRFLRLFRVNLVEFINLPTPDYDSSFFPDFSLGVFSRRNTLRRAAIYLSSWVWLERISLLIIILSCVNLGLEEPDVPICGELPLSHPDNCVKLFNYLHVSNLFITFFFTFELVVGVLCVGLFSTPNSYLRTGWTLLDALVVGVSLASLSPSTASQLSSLRSLRALRAMRALRLVSRFPSLRLVIDSMIVSLPRVRESVIIMMLFLYIFAVIGVQNFRGKIMFCSDPSVETIDECTGSFVLSGDLCAMLPSDAQEALCRILPEGMEMQRQWLPHPQSFDDIGNSMLVIFELLTGENWPVLMLQTVYGRGDVRSDEYFEPNLSIALFFIVVEIVMNQFLIELFTGVVIDTYLDLRNNSQGLSLLSDSQKLWVENMKTMLTARPIPVLKPPIHRYRWVTQFRRALFTVVRHRFFEPLVMFMIVLNLLTMSLRHYGQTVEFGMFLEGCNYFFTAVFGLEAVLKLVALGPFQFWINIWNRFDLLLVIGSLFSLIFSNGPLSMIFRLFRIFRIFRLVKYSKGITRLLRTLVLSLPSVSNVAGLLLLTYFVLAVVAMNLFSGVRFGWFGMMDGDTNFDSFAISFFTMCRASTGENFNGIMRELMGREPFCIPNYRRYYEAVNESLFGAGSGAVESTSFISPLGDQLYFADLDGVADGSHATDAVYSTYESTLLGGNCGTPALSALFWVFVFLITGFIMLNILVAIVMESFDQSRDDSSSNGIYRLSPDALEMYLLYWNKYDVSGSQFLNEDAVVSVISELQYPLGVAGGPLQLGPFMNPVSTAGAMHSPQPVHTPSGLQGTKELDASLLKRLRVEARSVFNRLPLVPNNQGNFHFHAVLHALMDRASGGQSLGAPTHAVALSESGGISGSALPNNLLRALQIFQVHVRAKVLASRKAKMVKQAEADAYADAKAEAEALELLSAEDLQSQNSSDPLNDNSQHLSVASQETVNENGFSSGGFDHTAAIVNSNSVLGLETNSTVENPQQ